MELTDKCPFCGGDCKRDEVIDGGDAFYLQCEEGLQCILFDSIWDGNNKKEIVKRFHQIYLFLKRSPKIRENGITRKYKFFYNENLIGSGFDDICKVNVAELMKSYPITFMDKMEKALYNLSKEYSVFGWKISVERKMFHLLYCENEDEKLWHIEIPGILSALCELGYLSGDLSNYCISAKGWEKVSVLEKTESNNQGFIAMSFRDETKSISDSFKAAIAKCGYIPRRIDEKEHNNQIVPEILFEISRSKFVVVDVTYPNYGAYYEAGYAEALGKEVIICCREDVFNSDKKPHFDIAQKSSIVWKDEEDLVNRLYRRIEATVGLSN